MIASFTGAGRRVSPGWHKGLSHAGGWLGSHFLLSAFQRQQKGSVSSPPADPVKPIALWQIADRHRISAIRRADAAIGHL